MSLKKFNRFDENWRLNPTRTRAAKYIIRDRDTSVVLDRLVRDCINWTNVIIRELHEGYLAGRYSHEEMSSRCSSTKIKGSKEKRVSLEKRLFTEGRIPFVEWGLALDGYARFRRSLIEKARQTIKSYKERNDYFPFNPPRLRNYRSLFVSDGVIKDLAWGTDDKRGQLKIRLPHGGAVHANYRLSKGSVDKRNMLNDAKQGGNLIRQKNCWIFVAAAKVPYKLAYTPVSVLGTDSNVKGEHFQTFSDDTVIQQCDELRRLTRELKKHNKDVKSLNKILAESKGKNKQASRKRRDVRTLVKQAHDEMDALCKPIAERIMAKVKAKQALLCIDGAAFGGKTGSCGHDKVAKHLIGICERDGIPFVVVPSQYTSFLCHHCEQPLKKVITGYTKTGRPRVSSDRRYCESDECQKEVSSHKNAAKNTAKRGQFIWQFGVQTLFSLYKQKGYKELYKLLKNETIAVAA